jgi:hypothetical protein
MLIEIEPAPGIRRARRYQLKREDAALSDVWHHLQVYYPTGIS